MFVERVSEQAVLIQDRSRMYRESLSILIDAADQPLLPRPIADMDDLVAACQSGAFSAVVFEAAGMPWSAPSLVGQVRNCNPDASLIGTYPQHYRSCETVEGVAYVPRSAPSEMFLRGIRGDRLASSPSPRVNRSPETLTQRELQVLALISHGLTTAQIGDRLGISAKTVEGRRQALFAKLGVQNQSHAVAVGIRSGLLGVGGPAR